MHHTQVRPTTAALCALVMLAGCGERAEQASAEPTQSAQTAEATAPAPEPAKQDASPAAADAAAPEGQLARAVVPSHYALELTLVPERDGFTGRVVIDVEASAQTSEIYLHGNGLSAQSVAVHQAERSFGAAYQQVTDGGVVKLTLAEPLAPGDAQIDIAFSGAYNESLEGLYKVVEAERAYVFTQFEAVSARLAFPGFDDPQFKTTFDLRVTAKPAHVVITTTPQTTVKSAPDGLQTRVFARTKPMPTYLLAFAVGPMDLVKHASIPANDIRSRPIPLRGAAARGKGPQLAYALEHTAAINNALEQYFGVEYPYAKLDIIAAPDFAAGAMENIGAILYREQLLLLNDSASLQQRRYYGLVHAHELAHQWFGNLVTPQWWSDIWLNEAFATWMAAKAAHVWNPELQFDSIIQDGALRTMPVDSLASARQIRQPVLDNNDIANAFDGITYRKGGGVLSMFESYLGESRFQAGVRLHMARFRHGVASSDDFMRSLADGSGEPGVVPAFRSFLDQPGVPQVRATLRCETDAAAVTLEQARYRPLGSQIKPGQQWQIPVCLRLVGGGQDKACTLLTEQSSTLALDACPDAVMPNADGAGYYRWSMDEAAMQALLANTSALSRFELVSLADSVDAGFRAGTVSAEVLKQAAAALANHPDWGVATALVRGTRRPSGALVDFYDSLADDATRAEMNAWFKQTYGPRLDAIGLDGDSAADKADGSGTTLLRAELVHLLAVVAQDAALRETLTKQADAYLGKDGVNTDAINPNLVETALRVGLADTGEPMAVRMRARLAASSDAILRQRLLNALATAPQPAITAAIRDTALTDTLRDNEMIGVLRDQFAEPAIRDAAWAWLRANFEPALARMSKWNQADLIGLTGNFCSADADAEVAAFYGERKQDLGGGPREYALAREQIQLCAALKKQRSKPFRAAFASR